MSHNFEEVQGRDDLRVKRTQQMVQRAFMELVVEVGFRAITVQMLAERAMINRTTFYRHYTDIYDLVEKVYHSLIDEYRVSVQAVIPGDPIETLERMFEHCATYAHFYLALLSELPQFQELVRNNIEEQTLTLFTSMGLDEATMTTPLPIVLRYWAVAQIGLVQWWLEMGQEIPAREMAVHLWTMQKSGPWPEFQLPY